MGNLEKIFCFENAIYLCIFAVASFCILSSSAAEPVSQKAVDNCAERFAKCDGRCIGNDQRRAYCQKNCWSERNYCLKQKAREENTHNSKLKRVVDDDSAKKQPQREDSN